jgi:hypothetical protein
MPTNTNKQIYYGDTFIYKFILKHIYSMIYNKLNYYLKQRQVIANGAFLRVSNLKKLVVEISLSCPTS